MTELHQCNRCFGKALSYGNAHEPFSLELLSPSLMNMYVWKVYLMRYLAACVKRKVMAREGYFPYQLQRMTQRGRESRALSMKAVIADILQ